MVRAVLLLVVVFGCSNESKTSPGAKAGGQAPPTPQPGKTGADEPAFTCDQAVPQPIRDKHLASLIVKQDGPLQNYGTSNTTCSFGPAGTEPTAFKNEVLVEISCTPYYKEPGTAGIDKLIAKSSNTKNLPYQKVERPGRGGVRLDRRYFEDDKLLWIVDTELPCAIEAKSRARSHEQLDALVTDIEAALK